MTPRGRSKRFLPPGRRRDPRGDRGATIRDRLDQQLTVDRSQPIGPVLGTIGPQLPVDLDARTVVGRHQVKAVLLWLAQ